MTTEHIGNKQSGVEIRRHNDGTIDEVLVYACGKCVVQTEQLDNGCVWMGIYTDAGTARINLMSRGHIKCNGELDV